MALHHAGFSVPPVLPPERWALTPPFHPYRSMSPSAARLREPRAGRLKVFLQMVTEANCTGGLFSVALSVAETFASLARSAPGAGSTCSPPKQKFRPPGVTRRVALWPLAPRAPGFRSERRVGDHGVRTFLPAGFVSNAGPAIARPIRRSDYTTGLLAAARDRTKGKMPSGAKAP